MRAVTLDDKAAVFAFRGVIFLSLILFLVHSPRQEQAFQPAPFVLAAFYLCTSLLLWRAPFPKLQTGAAQAAAYLWDVCVISAVMYQSEGFDDQLYLMYFLIMFMSGLMTQVRQSFLIGTVSSLVYGALWAKGKVDTDLSTESLLLRFAFFYVVAFFTAVMADRVRRTERRARTLELRLALGKIANGGWGLEVDEELDPELAKTVRTVNSLIANLELALKRTVNQNEELRSFVEDALVKLAHEKERLEAERARRHGPPP